MSNTMNVFSIGGSRNIGYFAAVRLLDAGCTVTFLLRNPSVLESDPVVSKHIAAGKAFLVKGDALVKSDVENGWLQAGKDRPVDLLVFSVGGTPKFSLTKGFVIEPENLVTHSLINTVTTIPPSQPVPKIVAISSNGLTKTSHENLPILLKPMYSHFLAIPHKDKIGAERLLHYLTGWKWNSKEDGEPKGTILPPNWETTTNGLPPAGSFKKVLVIRPALLIDRECKAEETPKNDKGKPPYRVNQGEFSGQWAVGRKDVAHFLADAVLNKWDEYVDKIITISY